MDTSDRTVSWLIYGAEAVGTALLVGVGLSIVLLAFGQGSPLHQLIPTAGRCRLLSGLEWFKIEVAKLTHFGHDRYGVFLQPGEPAQPAPKGYP